MRTLPRSVTSSRSQLIFESLFSNSCGEGIQQSVAKEIGVTLDDLKITINVLSHC